MIFVYDEEDTSIVKEIWMVRGDDEMLSVAPALIQGDEIIPEGYEMRPGDTLTLTVRTEPKEAGNAAASILMQITGVPGGTRIPIRHADTADLPYGQYSADVELLTEEGYHKTIWPRLTADKKRARTSNLKNFMICSEVT